MKGRLAVLCMILASFANGAWDDDVKIHPETIYECMRLPMASQAEITMGKNPYYLRGDFDGDGRPDYAVAVRGKLTKRLGVLICVGTGIGYLLGADNPTVPPFSDMPKDLFFAPNWAALSRQETTEISKLPPFGPRVLPQIRGETIAMTWEDGTALIYWDGQRFRWLGARK